MCAWKIRDGKHLSPGCPGFFKGCYYFIIFQSGGKKRSHIGSISEAAIIREGGSAVQASLKKGELYDFFFFFLSSATQNTHMVIYIIRLQKVLRNCVITVITVE